jgi:hypothetical protein
MNGIGRKGNGIGKKIIDQMVESGKEKGKISGWMKGFGKETTPSWKIGSWREIRHFVRDDQKTLKF